MLTDSKNKRHLLLFSFIKLYVYKFLMFDSNKMLNTNCKFANYEKKDI